MWIVCFIFSFELFWFQWTGKHPVKLSTTITLPWLKFHSSQNLGWTGGFIVFHLTQWSSRIHWNSERIWPEFWNLRKKSPSTSIPYNTKQHSAKLLLNILKKLKIAPYICISCFVCLTLPAYGVVLLWILLLPRLLLLFPGKMYGQLNLRKCRTILYVDSGSTPSSSCYICQELHRQKRHSNCQQGQSCGNCRGGKKLPTFLYIYLSVQKYQRMFPSWPKYLVFWCYCSHPKKDAQLWHGCVECVTEGEHDTSHCHQTLSKWGWWSKPQWGWTWLSGAGYRTIIWGQAGWSLGHSDLVGGIPAHGGLVEIRLFLGSLPH